MDVSRAQISNLGYSVLLVDPEFPWSVQAYLDQRAEKPTVTRLTVIARDPEQPITSTTLTEIPVRQIASVAASLLSGEGEALYRQLAVPRERGERSWSPEHYERVTRVASWARSIGREGGPAEAVAEFWGVHHRTARRWIAHQR